MATPDEYQLTITLSSAMLQQSVKKQLKKTYQIIRNGFKSGKGCVEFTKQGNVHYHIKTQDDYADVIAFMDCLKIHTTKVNDKRVNIFGFTHITQTVEKHGNYDYILKDVEKTQRVLKRLKQDYREAWEYEKKEPRPVQRLISWADIIKLDQGANVDSEEDWILNKRI